MGYAERNTWVQVVAGIVGAIVYLALLLPQLAVRDADDVPWQWPMVATIVGSIIASIVVALVWGIAVGMRDREAASAADQRDREIEWFGDRVGQAFLVIGGVAALILAMVGADAFWIGNTIFAGFLLSSTIGGIARLVAYRKGFQ